MDKLRKIIKKLANPRGLLYLYGLLAISWIISFCFVYRDGYFHSQRQAKQYLDDLYIQTDKMVQADIRASQLA